MFYSTKVLSPIGTLTLACGADGENLAGLWIEGQKHYGGTIPEILHENRDVPVFLAAKKWLARYFAGEQPAVSELPVAPIGSVFQKSVWGLLCEIPYGNVVTYGAIAGQIAKKLRRQSMSSQAVGGAVGRNPISIVIPCHRVVGSNGSLTGYAGGIGTKRKLLELEGADLSRLFIPKKDTTL